MYSAIVAVGLMAFDAIGLDSFPIVSKCLDVSLGVCMTVSLMKHFFDAPSSLVGGTEHFFVVIRLGGSRTESKHFFEVFPKHDRFVGVVGCEVIGFVRSVVLPLRISELLEFDERMFEFNHCVDEGRRLCGRGEVG